MSDHQQAIDPASDEWNDSLTHDLLWSRVNFGEALSDVMTPLTWTLAQKYVSQMSLGPRHPFGGNIGGRFYTNLSLTIALFTITDKNVPQALARWEPLIGRVPQDIMVRPLALFTPSTLLTVTRALVRMVLNLQRATWQIPTYRATTSHWRREMAERIQRAQTKGELVVLWRAALLPYYLRSMWVAQAAGTRYVLPANKLRSHLIARLGAADANALLANVSGEAGLASLGPLAGLSRLTRGELSREAYLEQYGHRSANELELAEPRPAENPAWLDERLAEFARTSANPEALMAHQYAEFDAAWRRFQERYPRQAKSMRHRLDQMAEAVRTREATRSEMVRVVGVMRAFALRAGQLTGLGEDIFFLGVDEMLAVLSGDDAATVHLPARRELYARYKALPPYPAIIHGRFDPVQWAADPNRRYDVFDAHAPIPSPVSNIVTGLAGSAGRVEGTVRRLNSPEEGDRFQSGEILVTATTNVGWTLIFPRAAAVITDVGAPLSHAAIVARELGIPAVVGCGNATQRLKTGDRVRVDGARGVVEIV